MLLHAPTARARAAAGEGQMRATGHGEEGSEGRPAVELLPRRKLFLLEAVVALPL